MIDIQLTTEEALILYSMIYDWHVTSISSKKITSESVLNKVKESLTEQLNKVEFSATTKRELNTMQSKAKYLEYEYGGGKHR